MAASVNAHANLTNLCTPLLGDRNIYKQKGNSKYL